MKLIKLLFILTICSFYNFSQVSYSVTVTKLMAKADDCDNSVPPFCAGSIQDPTFNIWCLDGAGNENTNCWFFDDDASINYNIWKDILDVQIGSQSNVLTSYIQIDMSGFESDQAFTSCSSSLGDDAVIDRTLAQQFPLSSLTEGVINTVQVSIGDIYYAELEIEWHDLTSGVEDLSFENDYILAPNPSNGMFKVLFPQEESAIFSVKVMDILGRVVYTNDNMTTNQVIDLSENEKGKYFVYIQMNDAVKVETILIQ